MAELHVQRRKNNYWWVWILILALIITAAAYWYMNYYQKNGDVASGQDTLASSTDTSTIGLSNTSTFTDSNEIFWQQVDFNARDTNYVEIKSKNVTEKANNNYAIYSFSPTVLFVDNKSDLNDNGQRALKEIGESINQRFKDAEVKIYSHIDSSIKKDNNQLLTDQRAEAVKMFLINNSKVNERNISVFPTSVPGSLNTKSNRIDIVAKR